MLMDIWAFHSSSCSVLHTRQGTTYDLYTVFTCLYSGPLKYKALISLLQCGIAT